RVHSLASLSSCSSSSDFFLATTADDLDGPPVASSSPLVVSSASSPSPPKNAQPQSGVRVSTPKTSSRRIQRCGSTGTGFLLERREIRADPSSDGVGLRQLGDELANADLDRIRLRDEFDAKAV